MTNVIIKGGLTQESAILLLAAAETLGVDQDVVRTTTMHFVAPQEVADEAGLEYVQPEEAAEGSAFVSPEAPVDENADGVPEDEAPKKSDNKAAWAEYAKAHGETDESLTKEALVEKYGKKE